MDEMFLRIPVAAHLLCMHPQTLRRLCAKGRVPCVNLGAGDRARGYRVPLSYIKKAICGQARWKYPTQIRRQAVTERTTDKLISQGLKDWEKIEKNEIRWSNDIEDANE